MTVWIHTLQGSHHWFDMILVLQFPSLWKDGSLLADLYTLSLYALSEHENKGICIVNLTLISSVLIETEYRHSQFPPVNLIVKNGNTISQADYF